MKVSSQVEYGLRCLLQVGRRGTDGAPVPISEIASLEGLSVEYVGKLLMVLRRGKLVRSVRGKAGGYLLARPAHEISLKDVMDVLSGPLYGSRHCDRFSGSEERCVHAGDCPVRPVWMELNSFLADSLSRVRLSHLISSETKARRMLRMSLARQALRISSEEPDFYRLPVVS